MRRRSLSLIPLLLALFAVFSHAQAPVPFVNQPLVPDATAPGGGDFTLTVNGTGFVPNSVVNWNGNALTTHFVSSSQLTATVPAADIATATTASLTVVNPTSGGGTSNVVFFPVAANIGDSGFFTLVASPATGGSVAVGDFNGDGKLDLAVANYGSGTISILLGDSTGNFTLASSVAVAGYYSVAVGDFNSDAKQDLAVGAFSVYYVLLGDGTGKFTLASSIGSDYGGGTGVAVGDLNGDGKLDLAALNWDSVSIMLGDGTGNFSLASDPATGSQEMQVAAGDFNGDGKLDLAVANYSGYVSILLGDGTGNFVQASAPAASVGAHSFAVADFNGDNKLDLAVGGDLGAVSILLGDGTGNFTVASTLTTGSNNYSLGIGDFNGDGRLDLAIPTNVTNTVSVFLGDGTGNFVLDWSSPTLTPYSTVAVADFNNDGKLDLAVSGNFSNTVSILLQGISTAVAPSPAGLTFGTQLARTASISQTVTLTSTGTATVDIAGITPSTNFSQTNNCGSSLSAGTSCAISVSFKPTRVGPLTGTVTITDSAYNKQQTVTLTGVGTWVSLTHTSIHFGQQKAATTSVAHSATLTNHAPHALTFTGFSFVGANPGSYVQTNTCGTSVAAGASCTIYISFSPRGRGTRTATLNIRDNGGDGPQQIALTGYGT